MVTHSWTAGVHDATEAGIFPVLEAPGCAPHGFDCSSLRTIPFMAVYHSAYLKAPKMKILGTALQVRVQF